MEKSIMQRWPLYGCVLFLVVALALAGCYGTVNTPSSSSSADSYTVKVMSKAGIGDYLVDANGMTLYCAAFDSNGESNATSAILELWPAFSESNFIVPSSLNKADFSTITTVGKIQATYKGWPLYYFVNDKASGDTLGEGVEGVWSVTAPDVVVAPVPDVF